MKNFNLDWKFRKEDQTDYQKVNLPHDAMIFETRDQNCHNGKNTGYFPGGKYIYEKDFALTEEDLTREIQVRFEGIYRNCRVFLNDVYLTSQNYGYTEFTAELNPAARAGENTLRVVVDNSLEPNSRWYSGSGIYRPAELLIREKGSPKLLLVRTVSIHPIRLEVETETGNRIEIWDGDKKCLEAEAVIGTTVLECPDLEVWDDENPKLYRVTSYNEKGEVSCMVGIRTLTWDAKQGLCVNGKRVLLRGGCIHHDNGVLAAREFEDAAYRKIRIMKEAGYNAVRSSHNPMSRELLEACDKLGMYVMDEAYDGWYTPKTHHDNARTFMETWKHDVTAMVLKDYNHPSVIMYSVGNEATETAAAKGQEFCGQMRDFVKSLDPTRPVTCGVNIVLNLYTNQGKGVYEEKEPYQPKALPPKTEGYEEKKTGSAFFNMMAGRLGGLMSFASGTRKAEAAANSIAPHLDVIGFNYGGSRFKKDLAKYPDRLMVASETLASDLPYNWSFVKKYPAVLGDFVWTAWDYLGESGLGDWTYPDYPGLPLLAGCGTIDLTGKITAEAFYQQVVWGIRKVPYIGVSPLNHAGQTSANGSWRFTDVLDSWCWDGYEGRKTRVEVFAEGSYIRLEKNGKVIGTKRLRKYKAIFHTTYEKGSLTAVALDKNKKEISRFCLESQEGQAELRILEEEKSLKADAMSLCYLPIEFTDKKGRLLPYKEERIQITVDGPAELAGLGSALAKTDESYTGSTFKSYRGRVLAVLRSTGSTGKIKVTVRAESGLEAEMIVIAEI